MSTPISKDRAIIRPSRWREEMARAERARRKPRKPQRRRVGGSRRKATKAKRRAR